jgi:hypothetical protein
LIVVAFLFPLALYCFVLGLINRRRRPLMVPAAWDFAGILFAASGFLVFAVPAMLTSLSERWRLLWLVGQAQGLANGSEGSYEAWVFVSAAYFLGVVLTAAYVLWGRRHQTAVYNVDPAVLEEVLAGVLDALGLLWSRAGSRYFLRHPGKRAPVREGESAAVQAARPARQGAVGGTALSSAEDLEQSAYLGLDLAPALRHVTLRWEVGADDSLREQVEGELCRALAEVRTRGNPVGGWMMTAGWVLLLLALLAFAAAVYVRLFLR